MKNEEKIRRGLETCDHIVWQAAINVCGMAVSKSFEQRENLVRVVYQTYDPEYPNIKDLVDPRKAFSRIEAEFTRLISLSLGIRKRGYESRGFNVAKSLCSHTCYIEFLIFGSNTMSESDKIDLFCLGGIDIPVLCDFVEFGRKGEDGYICCPCIGKHLGNTKELSDFKIDLQKPKKVGKDTYEFRFSVDNIKK